jgi:hypothetical protein
MIVAQSLAGAGEVTGNGSLEDEKNPAIKLKGLK